MKAAQRRVRAGGTIALAGLAVLVTSAAVARNGKVGPAERSVFDAINGLPDWLPLYAWMATPDEETATG